MLVKRQLASLERCKRIDHAPHFANSPGAVVVLSPHSRLVGAGPARMAPTFSGSGVAAEVGLGIGVVIALPQAAARSVRTTTTPGIVQAILAADLACPWLAFIACNDAMLSPTLAPAGGAG